jgi:AbrB family looped-hinge helix DNA binding protein
MTSIRVSSRYQIVIPEEMRAALGIKPGMRMHAIQYGERIALLVPRSTSKAQGFLSGIDTTVPRDRDRV